MTAPTKFGDFPLPAVVPLSDEELQRQDAEARAKSQREDLDRFLARLPAAYRWASFAAPELAVRCPDADARRRAHDAVGAKRVVLTGPAGAGKTSLAVAMLRAVFDSGRKHGLVFAHAFRLGVVRIQSPAGEGEPEYVRRAIGARVTLIDDVGSERQTQNNAVADVIFERHAEDAVTWITTGLSPESLAQRYGDGVARRMFEAARIIRVGAKP